jgi:hypothetical protein
MECKFDGTDTTDVQMSGCKMDVNLGIKDRLGTRAGGRSSELAKNRSCLNRTKKFLEVNQNHRVMKRKKMTRKIFGFI